MRQFRNPIRTHLSPILILATFFQFGITSASAQEPSDDPEQLASAAVKSNPAIKTLVEQISSLRYKTEAASIWADPVFAVEYSNVPWNTWSMGDSPMSGLKFKVQQKLTLPGKNRRRTEVMEAQTEVKRWQLREKKNQLRAMVKKAYWNLALVRELRHINERHIKLVDQLISVVRVKYQVGKVGQHDLLNLEVLRKKIKDDLGDYDQRQRQLTAAINAALHRDVATNINTPRELVASAPKADIAALVKLAKKYRPLLKEAKARSSWQRLAAGQVEYERWPDISVWAGYNVRVSTGADPGTDFFSVGLSVGLPLDYTGRTDSQKQEHLASASAADESYQAIFDQIRAELESSLASWTRAYSKAKNYETKIIPAADRTLKATLAAYQSDRAEFASLYQAELLLLDLERAYTIAKALTHVDSSTVQASIGTPTDTKNSEATP